MGARRVRPVLAGCHLLTLIYNGSLRDVNLALSSMMTAQPGQAAGRAETPSSGSLVLDESAAR
jgi:hypothetical protein